MTGEERPPAVAGLFYPADPSELEETVRGMLDAALPAAPGRLPPKALILPHAGHVYSGPVAASGYKLIPPTTRRVVLIGPSHRYPFRGIAAHSAHWFATPLGRIPLDREAILRIVGLPGVALLDAAHENEHSLEVHLPFLQVVLSEFSLVPLVVGEAGPDAVAGVLEALWDGPETAIVISSDLSHFHDYETARRIDRATAEAVEALAPRRIGPEQACGCYPVAGLLRLARRKGLEAETLDLRNSGDTSGDRSRVVGYGAFALS